MFDVHRLRFRALNKRIFLSDRRPLSNQSSVDGNVPAAGRIHCSVMQGLFNTRGAYSLQIGELRN